MKPWLVCLLGYVVSQPVFAAGFFSTPTKNSRQPISGQNFLNLDIETSAIAIGSWIFASSFGGGNADENQGESHVVEDGRDESRSPGMASGAVIYNYAGVYLHILETLQFGVIGSQVYQQYRTSHFSKSGLGTSMRVRVPHQLWFVQYALERTELELADDINRYSLKTAGIDQDYMVGLMKQDIDSPSYLTFAAGVTVRSVDHNISIDDNQVRNKWFPILQCNVGLRI